MHIEVLKSTADMKSSCYNFSFSHCNLCSHAPTRHAYACWPAMLSHSYLTHHLYDHMTLYMHISLTCTLASPQLHTLPCVLTSHSNNRTWLLTHNNLSQDSHQFISWLVTLCLSTYDLWWTLCTLLCVLISSRSCCAWSLTHADFPQDSFPFIFHLISIVLWLILIHLSLIKIHIYS